MVQLFSTSHTFAHPFSRVSSAFWRKYPNEQAPHVQAIDCYDRRIVEIPHGHEGGALPAPAAPRDSPAEARQQQQLPPLPSPSLDDAFDPSLFPSPDSVPDTSPSPAASRCLVSNRLISCYTALPSWLNRLGVSNHAYAIETSVVNPATRTMIVKSRNLTGSSLMVMEETCIYAASPTNPLHTEYRQQARITALLPVFASKFESFTLSNVSRKSQDGLKTIELLCQRLQQREMEGVEPMNSLA